MSERVIYEVEVPEAERLDVGNDTPAAYRVVLADDVPDCMVYGRYELFRTTPEWMAGPSCRWLVRHLLENLKAVKILAAAQNMTLLAIAKDDNLECRCGEDPYTDGELCPRCTAIYSVESFAEARKNWGVKS